MNANPDRQANNPSATINLRAEGPDRSITGRGRANQHTCPKIAPNNRVREPVGMLFANLGKGT